MTSVSTEELEGYFQENPKATYADAAIHFDMSPGMVNMKMSMIGGRGRKLRLSDRDRRVYEFVYDYIVEHCYPPSVREVAAGVDSNPAGAHVSLHRLVNLDYITMGDGPRMIRIVGSEMDMKGVRDVTS